MGEIEKNCRFLPNFKSFSTLNTALSSPKLPIRSLLTEILGEIDQFLEFLPTRTALPAEKLGEIVTFLQFLLIGPETGDSCKPLKGKTTDLDDSNGPNDAALPCTKADTRARPQCWSNGTSRTE